MFLKNLKITLGKMYRVACNSNSVTSYTVIQNKKQQKLLFTTFLLDRKNLKDIANKNNSIGNA